MRPLFTGRLVSALTLLFTVTTPPAAWQAPVSVPGADVRAIVARPFEPPASVYGPGHRGVDLRLTTGSEILAPRGGTVVFRGWVAGRQVVVLQHDDGLRSTLEPVASPLDVGSQIATGAVVGHLDEVGSHCAPDACLHWGVRTPEEVYLDPLALLHRPRAVLLPDDGP